MIRTMLDPRDLNGVSFFTTKNVPKNILWVILKQKYANKIMPISGSIVNPKNFTALFDNFMICSL